MSPDLIVVLALLVVLLALGAWTVRSLRQERQAEGQAREDHQRAAEAGALPPSLHPKIDLERCIGSGACAQVCPEYDVLAVVDGKAAVVNPTACIGHGECLRACPVDAIQLVIGHARRGVDIPLLERDFQTNVPGLYIVGELGGMGLIYNAMTQALQCMRSVLASLPPRQPGVRQLVIVGAGPAGIAASLAALEAKLDFVTLDQESLGGTVLHFPRNKIVMTKPVNLPLYGKLQVREVSKEDLLAVWLDIAQKTGLQVRASARVESVARAEDGTFAVQTAQETLRAQRVILALGRRGSPRKLGVPGEDLPKVVYSLLEPEVFTGRRCLVVGGGDSAIEAAISLAEAGATVHLAHRRAVFDRIKKKNQERIDAAVAAGRVTLLLDASTQEVRPRSVLMKVAGSALELDNDDVFVFIGGVLPTAFLEKAGVEIRTYKGEVFAPANA